MNITVVKSYTGITTVVTVLQAYPAYLALSAGTDFNNDGKLDYSLCMMVKENCSTTWHLQQILASMTQYKGMAQGFLFEVDTMQPLVGADATVYDALMHSTIV